MSYLLSCNLTNWSPEKIPATKMKIETMREQLPNPIRFIIDYITTWPENQISRFGCEKVYQDYLEWCGSNGEKPLTSKVAGKKFSLISIDRTHSRDNGVRVYQYILDHSKIIAKFCESGLGDIEEFSDTPQPNLPKNETADIPIFNVPEIIPPKIIPTLPEKNTPPPNTSKDKKADKKSDVTQDLFDYVTEQTEAPVISRDPEGTTSGTSETSKTPEPVIDEHETSKHPESIEPICEVVNMSPKETMGFQRDRPTDSPKPINQVSSAILLARQQRKDHLRKRAVELGEDLDVFVTITEKDRLDSIAFRDRMETDSQMCGYAKEMEEDPKEHMDMTIRERLIEEEIIHRSLEDDGVAISWLNTDRNGKKW